MTADHIVRSQPDSLSRRGMTRLVFATLWRHWSRHRTQFAMLLVGLAAATALLVGVLAINAQARLSYAEAEQTITGGAYTVITRAGGGGLTPQRYGELRRAGIKVAPLIEGRFSWGTDGERITILGIEPLSFMAADTRVLPDSISPDSMSSGTTSSETSEAALADFISDRGLAYGRPNLVGRLERLSDTAADLPRLVASPSVAANTLLVDISVADRLLGRGGLIDRFVLLSPLPAGLDPALLAGLQITPPDARVDLGELTESFHLNLTAFGLLSFLVGLFIVYAALSLASHDRLPLFGTLLATGVPRALLLRVLFAEMLVLAGIAGTLGIVIGYGIAGGLLPGVAATLRGLYGAPVAGTLSLAPTWWLIGLAVSFTGVLLAGGATLLRLARLPILAMRPGRAWVGGEARMMRSQFGLGALLLLLAFAVLPNLDSLAAAFVEMAALLLAASLLLPPILVASLTAIARLAPLPIPRWFWADAAMGAPKLSLALMALLLALSANLGIKTMIGGFRATFLSFLDERLAAELYVRAPNAATAPELADWLRDQPGVSAVLPNFVAQTRLERQQVSLISFVDHPTYRETWTLLEARPTGWQDALVGDGVLVSEQLARSLNLGLGDRLRLSTRLGDWSPPVVGIYADYGNPQGQIRVGLAPLKRYFTLSQATDYGVRYSGDIAGLAEAVRARFDLSAEAVIIQSDLKALAVAIFDQTFVISEALSVLTLLVAGVALLSSLLTVFDARLPQLAPLWGMGMRRAALVRLEGIRVLMLSLLTALIAVPVGLGVAWILVTRINVLAFGWRLPMVIDPFAPFEAMALAALTALVALIYPLVRLWRMEPARLAKIFAQEG